ncbi:uncharacterized protein V6R79_007159, partial [Siganus canaliculatus]
MAPQPPLKELWCAENFEVSDEVRKPPKHYPDASETAIHRFTSCRGKQRGERGRQKEREKGMNGEWGRYLLWMPTGTPEVHSTHRNTCGHAYISPRRAKATCSTSCFVSTCVY